MLEFFEREQLPGDVKSTLAAALNGDLHYQHLLFIAMIDSWPKLQSNLNEIARAVTTSPWKVIPFAKRGEDPTPAAEELAKECEEIIWRMRPDVKRGENDLEGMISNFATSYFMGHGVEEPRWEKAKDGWRIRATKPLTARYYGYPYFTGGEDQEDRLMLDPEGAFGTRHFIDFPDHRFLIGINKGHAGHASTAAPLRALAAYWLAAVYGLKWFMNFTQLYGIPWRHAEVADKTQDNAVARSLAEIGSRGYIITRTGTKINVLESSKGGGNSLPQRELIDLADKQCDTFILGQTLTSGTDNSGSRSLGEVHEGTRQGRIHAVADYVGRILTYQLLPSIVAVNYGQREDVPEMWARSEEAKDEKAKAERMEVLTRMNLPMSRAYVYDDLGVPMPADGDELFQPSPTGTKEEPSARAVTPTGEELEDDLKKKGSITAAYDPSQPRNPAGDEGGGRWTSEGAGSGAVTNSAEDMGEKAREAADDWDKKEGFWNKGFRIDPEEYQKNFGEKEESKGIISDPQDPFRQKVESELAEQMENGEFQKFLEAGPKFVVAPYKGEGLSPGDFGKNSLSIGSAAGFVVKLNKKGERAGYGIWGEVKTPFPEAPNVGKDIGSVIRHEYGHIFWQNAMDETKRESFFNTVKDPGIISHYAASNNNEVFPEAFALVTHPKFNKNDYPEWVGGMSDWMQKNLTK